MWTYFCFVLLLIPVLRTQCYWQLKWNDEFDTGSLDSNKWDVTNEQFTCDGNYIQQIHCKTNNSRNLWLAESTLAIAAVLERQKYLGKDYTSAMITTKEGFTFGRIEVRAALPKGKMLRPAMYLAPTENTGEWPKDGQVDLMANTQEQSIGNGIHIVRQNGQFIGNGFNTGADLKQFHSYILEWNESVLIWKFDQIQHLTINLTKELANYSNPFTHPFKLVISLGVGGRFFNGMLTKQDAQDWDCSLLILDYVRVYEWIGGNKLTNTSNVTNKNVPDPSSVCEMIMPLIRPSPEVGFPFTIVVSLLSLILMLALIPLVVYLFIKQKKFKSINNNRDSELDNYQGNELDVYYEDVQDNEYADPNNYTTEFTKMSIKKDPHNYIDITNKYVTK